MKKMLILVAIVMMFTISIAKSLEFESVQTNDKIKIDGNLNEWEKVEATVWNDQIYASFQHDNFYLYGVLICSDDRTKSEMLMRGMTIWFNPKGKTKQSIGIRYPMGMNPEKMGKMPDRETMMSLDEDQRLEKMLETLDDEALIYTSKDKSEKTNLSDIAGIEIKIDESEGLLVYEFKVPCVEKGPFLLNAYPQKNEKIGVGIEIGDDPQQKDEAMKGSGERGKMGAGRRPKEFSQGGRPGGEMMKKASSATKLWGLILYKK